MSMPHESLMSLRNFFSQGQVGNWLGQTNSVTCLPKGQAGIQVFVEPWLQEEATFSLTLRLTETDVEQTSW